MKLSGTRSYDHEIRIEVGVTSDIITFDGARGNERTITCETFSWVPNFEFAIQV